MAVKAATNTVVSYNATNITSYCDKATLDAAAESIGVTNLNSTAEEFIVTFANWSVPVGGPWDKALDDVLAPDIVSPGTARTAYIEFQTASNTVRFTWTTNAYLENYKAESPNPNEAIRWEATLRMSGAPTRSTT
jgi:hypothetical protein